MRKITDDIFLYEDSCNVYLLRSDTASLLIDFGRGTILTAIGPDEANRIEYVLHTHHHREQCQGDKIANAAGIPIAVPKKEALLFNGVEQYWNQLFMKRWDCIGAPYVRPLRSSIKTDRELEEGDTVLCGGLSVQAIETPGNSFGSMSFLVESGGQKIAFIGDLIMDGGKMVNFYDSEWDYGYGEGLQATVASCKKLLEHKPDILLPSHGEPIYEGTRQCHAFIANMEELIERYYLRDYDNSGGFENAPPGTVPSIIPEADWVSPHILRWKDSYGNMYVIIGEEQRAILVDSGIIHYEDPWEARVAFLEPRLSRLTEHYGIKGIDAVILTHYHGDHLDIYPYIREKYGAELWCCENMAEVIEYPERFNLTCLLPSYGIEDRIKVDRVLHEGEPLEWGGYRFDIFHLPGQTWHAMGMSAVIDGVHTVFSGDNLFYSKEGSGHDCFVTRNRVILEEGFIKCAEVLKRLNPDRLLCGHSIIINKPADQLERFYLWSYAFREKLSEFSPDPEYEWSIDPYWAEIYPYRSQVTDGSVVNKTIKITNHHHTNTIVKGKLCCPEGWAVSPGEFETHISARSVAEVLIQVELPSGVTPGRYPVTADIIEGGRDRGECVDAAIEVLH